MDNILLEESILKIGEVSGIEGRRIYVTLDKNKNTSCLLFNGDLLKNVSVGSYVEIKKGFICIIGKVEGEKLSEEKVNLKDTPYEPIDMNKRILTMSLSGYINEKFEFTNGISELPLIGDEAFILTKEKLHSIHNLSKDNSTLSICISKTEIEELPISFPIDGLFNGHIAIFGNTGSGKSNTLASLYQSMINVLSTNTEDFGNKCRFLIFDFNGEYAKCECIKKGKKVYNLSTKNNNGCKIPFSFAEFMDIETISILLEATEKTQKPFLKRTLKYLRKVKYNDDDSTDFPTHLMNILKKTLNEILISCNKDTANRMLEYFIEILCVLNENNEKKSFRDDINFHDTYKYFYFVGSGSDHFKSKFSEHEDFIKKTKISLVTSLLDKDLINEKKPLDMFFVFLLLQLIDDLKKYRVQIDHILPVINRFKAKQKSIEKIFEVVEKKEDLWGGENVVVINLRDVNIDMRKTIPLLLAKQEYQKHKEKNNKESLSIIVDEAHNILSKTSFRETEDWKDYRLETFEEIIKEGRKFGVFVTIASQRPNDISETIISQIHNYFIHQLVNQRDLQTIGNAVSYIDKLTEESIPTLPVGTCIFSGISTPMPLRLKIDELPDINKPKSDTLKFNDILKNKDDGYMEDIFYE